MCCFKVPPHVSFTAHLNSHKKEREREGGGGWEGERKRKRIYRQPKRRTTLFIERDSAIRSFIGELLSPLRELVCEPSRCANVLTFIETPWWKVSKRTGGEPQKNPNRNLRIRGSTLRYLQESNGYRSQIFGLLGVFEKTNEWTKRGAA